MSSTIPGGPTRVELTVDGPDETERTWSDLDEIDQDNSELPAPETLERTLLSGANIASAARLQYDFFCLNKDADGVTLAKDADRRSDATESGSPVWVKLHYTDGSSAELGGDDGMQVSANDVPTAVFGEFGGVIVRVSMGAVNPDDVIEYEPAAE